MKDKTISRCAKILYLVNGGIRSWRELARQMGYKSIGGFTAIYGRLFGDGLLHKEPRKTATITITAIGLEELNHWAFQKRNGKIKKVYRVVYDGSTKRSP